MLKNDLGPLSLLVGPTGEQTWKGNKGVDLAPDSEGIETNLYEDQITFTELGEVENAEEQVLMAVRYHQQVFRIKDNKLIHDQTGYWLWEQDTENVIHTFSIPRGLSVVAIGLYTQNKNTVQLKVEALLENQSISQIPFLSQKATTHSFGQVLDIDSDMLKYEQLMQIEIYGRMIEHKDKSVLRPAVRAEFEL